MHHHSLFCRTRRAMSEGGFLTTIHSIMEVAADNAYLFGRTLAMIYNEFFGEYGGMSDICYVDTQRFGLPGNDVLCMIISQTNLRRSPYRNPFRFSIINREKIWLCISTHISCSNSYFSPPNPGEEIPPLTHPSSPPPKRVHSPKPVPSALRLENKTRLSRDYYPA